MMPRRAKRRARVKNDSGNSPLPAPKGRQCFCLDNDRADAPDRKMPARHSSSAWPSATARDAKLIGKIMMPTNSTDRDSAGTTAAGVSSQVSEAAHRRKTRRPTLDRRPWRKWTASATPPPAIWRRCVSTPCSRRSAAGRAGGQRVRSFNGGHAHLDSRLRATERREADDDRPRAGGHQESRAFAPGRCRGRLPGWSRALEQ